MDSCMCKSVSNKTRLKEEFRRRGRKEFTEEESHVERGEKEQIKRIHEIRGRG